ncbi:MAG TPA: FAD-dependent monooxygenase [Geopsychrobacteraceae bacterium]|nr:FAD-dependent monooxygenase [Geopsychrobacteraceae bacterium]
MADAPDYDVLIVGGDPAGPLPGNMLGQKGLSPLLIEKTSVPPVESMASGILPRFMELFHQLGLDRDFFAQGVPVDHANAHEGRSLTGPLSFRSLDHWFSFIPALPQATFHQSASRLSCQVDNPLSLAENHQQRAILICGMSL